MSSASPASAASIVASANASATDQASVQPVAPSADGRREEVGHRTHGRHIAVGIDDARAADLDQCGSGRRRPFREHLGTRRSAEADDDVRAVILGEAPIAEQGIGIRDTAGERTHRRHRVGDDRPSGGAVEHSDVGRSDPAASTGEDHAPFGIDGGGYRGGRTRPADGRRGPRRGSGSAEARPRSGSRNGRLSCTGPAAAFDTAFIQASWATRARGCVPRHRRPRRPETSRRDARRDRSGRWSAVPRRRATPRAGPP